MIVPGYRFRFVNGMITNFHMPGSTLLLLVAAFTGNNWKKIYEHALRSDYRFLSYGDAMLLLPTHR
jgi:S-adenosylmethionine:tRNA ribosyltransferase-isomerase